jgi:hypothetical protein
MIHGTLSLTALLMMYAEPEEEQRLRLCLELIGRTLHNILKRCDSSQEVVISTMQDALIKRITIAISSEPKKTPEKNGAT